MIQELLGGTSALLGDTKISINTGILEGTPCPNTSNNNNTIPTTTINNTTTTTITNTTTTSEGQNLRCPRCDSTNTKFCYYNNYNLTQPRHFCKTCRRYWTKGGALRNVPIGGGCRKNKNNTSSVIQSSIGKSSVGKLKTFSSHEFGIGPSNGGILWASPQNSHILALLKAAQNSNNTACISSSVNAKDAGGMMMSNLNCTDARTSVPSLALNSSWGNNQNQLSSQNNQQQNGFTLGDSGLQELYQRLRSSSGNYSNEQCPNILGNMGSVSAPSTSSTSILESAPVAASDLSYSWNPAFSWPDLPTTNGAYP